MGNISPRCRYVAQLFSDNNFLGRLALTCTYWAKEAYGFIKNINMDSNSMSSEMRDRGCQPPWARIGAQCTSLRKLYGGELLNVSDVAHLTNLTQLEEFDIRGVSASSRVAMLQHLTFLGSLRRLNLSWMRDVQDRDLVLLAKYLTSLRHITLSGLSQVTRSSISSLHSMAKLTRLGLYGCTSLGDGLFEALKAAPNLLHLSVRSISTLTPPTFSALGNCASLTRLSVRNTPFNDISAGYLSYLTNLRHISMASTKVEGWGLTSLQSLHGTLKVLDLIWDDKLREIPNLGRLTSLEILRLDLTPALNQVTWMEVCLLQKLNRLDADNCQLTGAAVRTFSALPNLTAVDIGNNDKITPEDVMAGLIHCPLKNLRMEGCSFERDDPKVKELYAALHRIPTLVSVTPSRPVGSDEAAEDEPVNNDREADAEEDNENDG